MDGSTYCMDNSVVICSRFHESGIRFQFQDDSGKNSKYTTGAGAIAAAMESIPAEAVELTKAEAQKAQEAREQAEAEAKRKRRKKLREKRQKKLHGHRSLQKIRNFWHRSSSVRQEISLMKDRLRSEQ